MRCRILGAQLLGWDASGGLGTAWPPLHSDSCFRPRQRNCPRTALLTPGTGPRAPPCACTVSLAPSLPSSGPLPLGPPPPHHTCGHICPSWRLRWEKGQAAAAEGGGGVAQTGRKKQPKEPEALHGDSPWEEAGPGLPHRVWWCRDPGEACCPCTGILSQRKMGRCQSTLPRPGSRSQRLELRVSCENGKRWT